MNTKKLLVLLLALVMVISLWACNDPGEGDGTTEAPGTTTEAPGTTTEAPGTTTEAPGTTEEPADPIDPAKPKHTVTFKADGKEVGKVEFSEGAKKITEPDVPAKEHYDGEWEDYTLGTTDITVNAVYTLKEYKVEFYVDGNRYKGVSYTIDNKTVVPPVVPAKAGYTGVWEDFEVTSGDIRVNAVYTTIEYTMTFKADGNEVGTAKFTVESTSVNLPEIPAKEGYKGAWPTIEFTAGDKTINAVYSFDVEALEGGVFPDPEFNGTKSPFGQTNTGTQEIKDGKLIFTADPAKGNGIYAQSWDFQPKLGTGDYKIYFKAKVIGGQNQYAIFNMGTEDNKKINITITGEDQVVNYTNTNDGKSFVFGAGNGDFTAIEFEYLQIVKVVQEEEGFNPETIPGGIYADPTFKNGIMFDNSVKGVTYEGGKLVARSSSSQTVWAAEFNNMSKLTTGTYRIYFKATLTEGQCWYATFSFIQAGKESPKINGMFNGTDQYVDIELNCPSGTGSALNIANDCVIVFDYIQIAKIS